MSARVLIIYDDIDMTVWLKGILEERSFWVKTIYSIDEAMMSVWQRKPDVIILDLASPGLEYLQLCRNIRSVTKTPILVLSALNNPGMVAKALDGGADDYLCKPVHNCVLIAHLEKLVRRNHSEQNNIVYEKCFA